MHRAFASIVHENIERAEKTHSLLHRAAHCLEMLQRRAAGIEQAGLGGQVPAPSQPQPQSFFVVAGAITAGLMTDSFTGTLADDFVPA